VELIRKILDDDADIRNHTEAWMTQLQHLMQSTAQERRLRQVYSANY
jgi:flagellar protein FliT